MFTIFHLLELVSVFIGLLLGAACGCSFGWFGIILGSAVGILFGRIMGKVPYTISAWRLRRELKRSDTAALRSRLGGQYFISHLIIAELVARGESIESFKEYVAGLLCSTSSDQRRFGELNRQLWPEMALFPASLSLSE